MRATRGYRCGMTSGPPSTRRSTTDRRAPATAKPGSGVRTRRPQTGPVAYSFDGVLPAGAGLAGDDDQPHSIAAYRALRRVSWPCSRHAWGRADVGVGG